MNTIYSYLTFNGNCRQAMQFYKQCLGGHLSFQTIGESPLAERMPDNMKQCILHATLKNDKLLLMGSDIVNDRGLYKGNTVSLMLSCSSEKEIRDKFEKLSHNAKQMQPLETTHWQAIFGSLTDKFGNHWLFNFENDLTTKNIQYEKD